MTHPETTSGAVANPNSSAPSKRRNDHIAARLHLAVDLYHDAVAKPVEEQDLLGFGQPQFPRRTAVLDGGERRRARPAVVAGDQHDIGMRFRDPGSDCADADLGDELDVHARPRVGILEVVDQLGEVLNRVDVMVRRR